VNTRFLLTALSTSALNLILHTLVFVIFLNDFFAAHPAGSAEFLKQLNKDLDQLVLWALLLSALSLGLLITLVVRWSGARTLASGLKSGVAFGALYWAGINFGLYASSNLFSLPSVLVDLVCSAGCMAMSAGFAAWMLGRAGARSAHEGQLSDPTTQRRQVVAAHGD
jgi:hypothetical protein